MQFCGPIFFCSPFFLLLLCLISYSMSNKTFSFHAIWWVWLCVTDVTFQEIVNLPNSLIKLACLFFFVLFNCFCCCCSVFFIHWFHSAVHGFWFGYLSTGPNSVYIFRVRTEPVWEMVLSWYKLMSCREANVCCWRLFLVWHVRALLSFHLWIQCVCVCCFLFILKIYISFWSGINFPLLFACLKHSNKNEEEPQQKMAGNLSIPIQ